MKLLRILVAAWLTLAFSTPSFAQFDGSPGSRVRAGSISQPRVAGYPAGGLISTRTLTTVGAGTYYPTPGTAWIEVELQAGGAGGGATVSAGGSTVIGIGGCSGMWEKFHITSGFNGATYSVGAAGTANSGTGGNTSFTTTNAVTYTAPGGVADAHFGPAGGPQFGTNNNCASVSYSGPAPDISINGRAGAPGEAGGTSNGSVANAGGQSPYSAGGLGTTGYGVNLAIAGIAATGYGGGGSGALGTGSAGVVSGGAGSQGLIIIREYN